MSDDRILRLDAYPNGVVSLVELHDETLDATNTPAWAVFVTAPDGELISNWGDQFIPSVEEAAHRYCHWIDRMAGADHG